VGDADVFPPQAVNRMAMMKDTVKTFVFMKPPYAQNRVA
jgi:hypothetical protein